MLALLDLLAAIEGKTLSPSSIPVSQYAFRPKRVAGGDRNDNNFFYSQTGDIVDQPAPEL